MQRDVARTVTHVQPLSVIQIDQREEQTRNFFYEEVATRSPSNLEPPTAPEAHHIPGMSAVQDTAAWKPPMRTESIDKPNPGHRKTQNDLTEKPDFDVRRTNLHRPPPCTVARQAKV